MMVIIKFETSSFHTQMWTRFVQPAVSTHHHPLEQTLALSAACLLSPDRPLICAKYQVMEVDSAPCGVDAQ